jgi:hypothetical protein
VALAVYVLSALTSLAVALLLLRGYGKSHARLLLWSGLCFVGITLNNILLIVDFLTGSDLDLSTIRSVPALVGLLILIYGMIFDSD